RVVWRVDVKQIDRPKRSRNVLRVRLMCSPTRDGWNCWLCNNGERSKRIWLPSLDEGGVDAGRIRDSVGSFNDGGQQDVKRIVVDEIVAMPTVEDRASGVDLSSVVVGEIHPAADGSEVSREK